MYACMYLCIYLSIYIYIYVYVYIYYCEVTAIEPVAKRLHFDSHATHARAARD